MAEAERTRWTDERIDDLRDEIVGMRREMNRRFDRLEGRFEGRFDSIDQRFELVDQRFERVDQRFERVDQRFDALYRTLIAVGGGMIASILVGAAGIAATQL